MTADNFRQLALKLPEVQECAHMNHPDFRVCGKIFATLGPKEEWGMVKLTPEQQESFMRIAPTIFSPATGAWGRRGCTIVALEKVKVKVLKSALAAAWRNIAPKKLVEKFERPMPPAAMD